MNAEIDIRQTLLKTERLTLRAWQESDLEDFYAYASVDGVGQMAGWLPHKDRDESRRILSHFIEEKKTFALVFNEKAIGSLGVEEYNEEKFPEYAELKGRELGYVLSKEYWGNGFMPEAVNAVVKYLFETIKLDFILVGHFEHNDQSARVIEKCGFKYIKKAQYETRFGTIENCKYYILYRRDYHGQSTR